MGSAHRIWSLLALVALLTVAVGAPGCGDDGPHLTKAQFLKQGNAICAQAEADQVRLANGHEKALAEHVEVTPVLAVFVPPMEKELRRLKALDPPQGDEEEIRAILAAIGWGINETKSDFLDLYVKAKDPFRRAAKLASEYGLEVCAGSSYAVIKPAPSLEAYGEGEPAG